MQGSLWMLVLLIPATIAGFMSDGTEIRNQEGEHQEHPDSENEERKNSRSSELLSQILSEVRSLNSQMEKSVNILTKLEAAAAKPYTCSRMYEEGVKESGVQTHTLTNGSHFDAYCDMETQGGGWTVIQRRVNGSVDFYRGWKEYAAGFGDLEGDYWLGLRQIYLLTKGQPMELYVGVEDFDLGQRYAKYTTFWVTSEEDKFRLHIEGYSGDAGDSLQHHNNMFFSTKDEDNDTWVKNCSQEKHGAWWYYRCGESNLNGLFANRKAGGGQHMLWYRLEFKYVAMKSSVMMIRPSNFR